jgi:hypothetical protein
MCPVFLFALHCVSVAVQVRMAVIANLTVFIGALAKLRKATVSFVTPVSQSARTEQLGSHLTDFHEIRYVKIFRKYFEKIPDSLKSDKNNVYFTR